MTVSERRVARKGRARQRDQERTPIDPSALIVTRRLSKRYDKIIAVDHLDIEVRAGEIFGLLGQNGAGKTTTILMLLGLTEPSSGGARVAGYDPARNPIEVKRRVGYLPDNVGFYDGMTGRQNLRYTAKLNGLSGDTAEAKISEAIEHVGMTDRADSKVETYSRGMKQRLGIADALVKDPEILILDEPTTAIDPIGVIEILDLLRRLVRERGLAVLLSSHLLQQVQSVCDRVGIFAAGKLIGVGTVAELADTFGEEAARIEVGFEGLDPREYPATVESLRAIPGVSGVHAPTSAAEPFVVLTQPRDATGTAREALIKTALAKGLRLSSIREVAPSLDDIYRRALHASGLAGQRGAAA
ncbi:MAG TPA: ABC transporter ATP-binding protein [Candidatus Limnocylindrales bacterium]|nr:ABC transporter ATP-binding protein [Candidatus Limnocylindrales bacterium]